MSQTFKPIEMRSSPNSVQSCLKYKYTPLSLEDGAFRVLCVRPSDDPSSDIYCVLIPGKVGQKIDYAGELLDYHPLSYVWGDTDPPKTIYVEGKPMVIRPNLFAALKQLRWSEQPLLLWVDAICIDQNNFEERNQQVNLMKQIYKSNNVVYMWLGEEADGSDLAMETLSLIKDFIEEPKKEKQDAKLREIMKASFDGSFDQHWLKVTHLFRRQYWMRVWILQEVLLSEQALFHCGSKRLPWTPIHSFLVAWPSLKMGPAAQRAMYYSSWARELAKVHIQVVTEKISLLNGLLLSRQRLATVSVDHVYGILSIVDLKGRGFPPNYNNGTMTVFRDVVLHTIQTECNLDILTACRGHNLGSTLHQRSRRIAVPLVHSIVLHILQQLERVPYMVSEILNNPNSAVQFEDSPTADKSGSKRSPESSRNGDDLSVVGLDPPGGFLEEGSRETQAALQELQKQLQVPHYRAAMQEMLRKSKLSDILRFFKNPNSIDFMERKLYSWPSWIPDWTIPHPKIFQPGILYLLLSGPKPSFYQAAGKTEPVCTFSEDKIHLVVRGGLFDRVCHVSPHYREKENPSDKQIYQIAELDWQLYCTLVDSTNPYGDEEARLKAFRGTQVLGRDVLGKEEDFSDGTFHDMFWKRIGVTESREDLGALGDLSLGDPRFDYVNCESTSNFRGSARIEQAVSYMRYDCRFFITQQGHIGKGPPSLQPGDQVCILFGGRVPFILRKDKEAEEFQLAGEAYVHGIMKGEAMRDLSTRDFVLG